MSYDLGVWYSPVALGPDEAGAFYRHMDGDWVTVRRRPEFDAFWQELTVRLPDLRSPNEPPADLDELHVSLLETMESLSASVMRAAKERDKPVEPLPSHLLEASPWSVTLVPTGSAIQLAIRFSRVEKAVPVILEMAARHGLVVYNPQTGEVTLPPSLQGRPIAGDLQPRLTLRITGEAPTLAVEISLDGQVASRAVLSSRKEAHVQARALAIAQDLPLYAVDDPACAAQAMDARDTLPADTSDPIARLLMSYGVAPAPNGSKPSRKKE